MAVIFGVVVQVFGPLLSRSDVVPANMDVGFTWIAVEHLQDVLLHGARWQEAPLGWPHSHGTAHADWLPGLALLALPLRLAELDPSRASMLAGIGGLVLTGWAVHLAAVWLLGRGPHTWFAGVAGAMVPSALLFFQHANLLHHELAILGPALFVAGVVPKRPLLAGLGSFLALATAHMGVYSGLHGGFIWLVLAIGAACAREGDRRTWALAAVGAALALASLLPVAAFYREAAQVLAIGGPDEVMAHEIWDPSRFFTPCCAERATAASPGRLLLLLTVPGAWLAWRQRGRRWLWLSMAVGAAGAASLSLGPHIHWDGEPTGLAGPAALLAHMPVLDGLRGPSRWWQVAVPALALFAALPLAWVGRRLHPALSAPIALAAIWGLELQSVPMKAPSRGSLRIPDALLWLDEVDQPGALVETPGRGDRSCKCSAQDAVRAALFHRRPVVVGPYARPSPVLDETLAATVAWPENAPLLRAMGVVLVLEHPPLSEDQPRGWWCGERQEHRLCVDRHPANSSAQSPVAAPGWADEPGTPWLPTLPVRTRTMAGLPTLSQPPSGKPAVAGPDLGKKNRSQK